MSDAVKTLPQAIVDALTLVKGETPSAENIELCGATFADWVRTSKYTPERLNDALRVAVKGKLITSDTGFDLTPYLSGSESGKMAAESEITVSYKAEGYSGDGQISTRIATVQCWSEKKNKHYVPNVTIPVPFLKAELGSNDSMLAVAEMRVAKLVEAGEMKQSRLDEIRDLREALTTVNA